MSLENKAVQLKQFIRTNKSQITKWGIRGVVAVSTAMTLNACNQAYSTPPAETSTPPGTPPATEANTAIPYTPTSTLTASALPTETILPTNTLVVDSSDIVLSSQHVFNNIAANKLTEHDVLYAYIDELIRQEQVVRESQSGILSGKNSDLTARMNPWTGPGRDLTLDPRLENGFNENQDELQYIKDHGDLLTLLAANPTVGSLLRVGQEDANLKSVTVTVKEDDWDAGSAILGAALQAEFAGTPADKNRKLQDAIVHPKKKEIRNISYFQKLIEDRLICQELGVSQQEQARRANKDPMDASAQIDPAFRGGNNINVNEEMRGPGANRMDQPQTLVSVNHTEGGPETYLEANGANESFLMTLTLNTQTHEWTVTVETDRRVKGGDPLLAAGVNYPDSVTGNEIHSCAPGAAAEATPISSHPSSTPTRPVEVPVTVTMPPTQPPQPTRTPGGDGSTPVVNTPVDTPVPTIEVTVPPVPTEVPPVSTSTPAVP